MSLKRLTLRRKKTLSIAEQAQEEVLSLLGLARHRANPLELPVMYEISTWNQEDLPAQAPSELPHTFLHRLWLLSPQARSPLCQTTADSLSSNPGEGGGQCAVNPQDLVTAVYMSANNFLQQEMTARMAQCSFAVPLLLPPSRYGGLVTLLVWPLRSVVRTWRPQSLADPDGYIKGDIASSNMPLLSFVRLGRCSISKSLVVNHILGGFRGPTSCFLHRAMDGGQLPRRLSNGLVEISWYLPSGDRDLDIFHEPVMVANLRGDAASSAGEFGAQLGFLCRNSSAIFMFCESLGEQERLQLASFRDSGCRVFLIICTQKNGVKEKQGRELWKQEAALEKLAEDLELPEGAVMSYSIPDGEEELANALSETVARLLRDSLRHMTLVQAAATAYELGIATDEGETCQIALAFEEEVLEGIDVQGASEYKEEQLPLQGQLWKSWVQEDKEECRQKNSIKSAQIQLDTMSEIESFCSDTRVYNMTEAMRAFTAALLTPDTVRRAFFLNWMRLKLSAMAWQSQPIKLRSAASSTWESDEITEDSTEISNEEVKQLQFPLCLENFTREMGLVFETSIFSPGSGSDGLLSFPAVAADLLLCGVPFELLDGDASSLAPQWLGSVLSVVHGKLPKRSRLRVLTVLGLHTSNNPAVISALLGVTFPVGDNQNTRGAYMLLLAVPENLIKELACNFLLLINTAGLNCSGTVLEQELNTSNNELATFTMGLSDMTLLNLPINGETEFQDTLLIAVNALLRVKETGRSPFFQAVAQEGGEDSRLLIKLLSQVTQILAAGEVNVAKSSFENLQELDVTSSKQYLRGPWQNSHPMAPVSLDYSKTVMDYKQSLFHTLSKCAANTPARSLQAFSENMADLWDTLLFDKFPFELKSMDVGKAFCDLCREYTSWQEEFLGYMEPWIEAAVQLVLTFEESTLGDEDIKRPDSLEEVFIRLKMQAATEVESEATKVFSNLKAYFRKGTNHSSLIRKYKDNFTNHLVMLKEHMASEANNKLEAAKREHDIATKTKDLQTKLIASLDARLESILEQYKVCEPIPEDEQLQKEFDQVWNESISKVDHMPLKAWDITQQVLQHLKVNLSNRGISKHLDKLEEFSSYVASVFIVDENHFGYRSRQNKMFSEFKMEAQAFADRVIEKCRMYISRKKSLKRDYTDSYTVELLKIVDNALETKQFNARSRFEVELKMHICASAAHSFQEIHENFNRAGDPLMHLEESRDQLFWNFVYKYRKTDQCRKVARAFTTLCLKPAMLDYIYSTLGKLICEQMLCSHLGQLYHSPQAFHFSLLRDLLLEDSFESFLEYLLSTEGFIRGRIQDHIDEYLSETEMLSGWTQQHLRMIADRMVTTVLKIGRCWDESSADLRLLLESMCDDLEAPGDIVMPRETLRGPIFQISFPGDRFIECLEESLAEVLQSLNQEFWEGDGCSPENIASKIQALPIQPQDHIYLRVRGCEESCPFCKAPCEAWDEGHTTHQALLHRPKGLVSYTCATSGSLSHSICPSEIFGENQFCNADTDGHFLRYRDYQLVYPTWSIPAEAPGSQRLSFYWKYVLARHNSKFAQEYQCNPAELPEEWVSITSEDAIQSLRETFGME